MNAIQTCHQCQHGPRSAARPEPCAGACPCLADPQHRDISELAAAHACPLNQFPARGLGDTVATVIHAITGISPCGGCQGRKAALNDLVPYDKKP